MEREKRLAIGFVVRKTIDEPRKLLPFSVFGEDNDSEIQKPDVSYQTTNGSTMRNQHHSSHLHEEALAADPTAFDYDNVYEQIQAEGIAGRNAADKKGTSKYVESIQKAHEKRKLEKQSREDRKKQKQRINEGDLYADKEVFVTGAYREYLEKAAKRRQQEDEEGQVPELTSVECQPVWQSSLAIHLFEDMNKSGNLITRNTIEMLHKPRLKQIPKDQTNDYSLRKQQNISIFFSTNHETYIKFQNKEYGRSLTTSQERFEERCHKRKELRREPAYKAFEVTLFTDKKNEEEKSRLIRLKTILRQKHGPEEIEELRRRYLERKKKGFVVPPL